MHSFAELPERETSLCKIKDDIFIRVVFLSFWVIQLSRVTVSTSVPGKLQELIEAWSSLRSESNINDLVYMCEWIMLWIPLWSWCQGENIHYWERNGMSCMAGRKKKYPRFTVFIVPAYIWLVAWWATLCTMSLRPHNRILRAEEQVVNAELE